MFETPGLTSELIEAVRREGGDPAVEHYLRKFAKDGEWKTDNLIYQVTPSYLYYWVLTGPTPYGGMEANNYNGSSGLGFISLTSTSAEVTYNGENYYGAPSYQSVPDIVSGSGSKLFINDCIITPDFNVDQSGREAVYGKFKWLYLPGEATSSVIRSVAVFYLDAISMASSGYNKTRIGRVRIKDSGGNPVTISKATTRSLLVEYTFTIPTL
jgi:hypothetical protein